jgi:serine/threonine protein kinase
LSEVWDGSDRVALLREAGSGPASVVYLAERQGRARRRPVAIKLLGARFPRDIEILVGMRDRARSLGMLGHRNVVACEDVVRSGGRLGLASPWVEGVDLVEWMEIHREHDQRIPGRVACDVIRGVAAALDAALHRTPPTATTALALIHRDLKPTNVMVDRDGEVKVLDFGSGFTSIAGRGARAGALQKGLVKYLSPTRREGKRGGAPADVYALGILALELLRGRWLQRLPGQNPSHDRYLAEVVARLGDVGVRTGADERALNNSLLRMVAYDPDARPPAAEVAHTFRTLADRAFGPSLESYAIAHVLPWIPAVADLPPAPDEAVEVVVDPLTVEPFADEGAPADPRPVGTSWEETDTGWVAVQVAPYDDDDDISLQTPLPTPHRAAAADDDLGDREPTAELWTAPPEAPKAATTARKPTPLPARTPIPAAAPRRPPDPTPILAVSIALLVGVVLGMSLLLVVLALFW